MKRPPHKLRTIGLIANPEKPSCLPVLHEAINLIQRAGREVRVDATTAEAFRLRVRTESGMEQLAEAVDLLILLGGDGTVLRVAREIAGECAPMLGVNLGRLGFLTAISAKQLPQALADLWAGQYDLESRPLVVARGSFAARQFLALNEFVLSRGTPSRLIELEVSVDDEMLTRYLCDGLIVSSPTGSTAYSLSAGGAIVSPKAEVFTLTPICPHTLSNRSVIVGLASTIRVTVVSGRPETILTADGQVRCALARGDQVVIRRSRRRVRLVRLRNSSFFGMLRQKLNWSGSNI